MIAQQTTRGLLKALQAHSVGGESASESASGGGGRGHRAEGEHVAFVRGAAAAASARCEARSLQALLEPATLCAAYLVRVGSPNPNPNPDPDPNPDPNPPTPTPTPAPTRCAAYRQRAAWQLLYVRRALGAAAAAGGAPIAAWNDACPDIVRCSESYCFDALVRHSRAAS